MNWLMRCFAHTAPDECQAPTCCSLHEARCNLRLRSFILEEAFFFPKRQAKEDRAPKKEESTKERLKKQTKI